MTAATLDLDQFASLKWVAPYISSPNWIIKKRVRAAAGDEEADIFNRETMCLNNGVQHWIEMYEKPSPGTTDIKKSISLCKFGTGLGGFIGMCHGGAAMTLMDEALGFAMIASETERTGDWATTSPSWKKLFAEGRPINEVLNGFMVTARLDIKFLKPVLCPGVVGIEVDVLENRGHKMKLRGVMKDANGVPLIQADGIWVRLGGASKI
ncbi:hypothetical protein B0J11DRAFT_101175 [Dendryphion nanum]|uniref:Thioesterase domain-containing protein n=1 Tax=Dendryphion nanum TaxID=256645 RepID=A0A9P9DCG0_9PLEO|nr:hypothetical protein B0J11DRAFT_101175 [Dendryphion nanum]